MTHLNQASQNATVLEAHNMALSFNATTRLIEGLNLRLTSGEITALIGPSGVGKSSLLKVLAGLNKPQDGTVVIDGHQAQSPHPQVAMAFQHAALLPWLNVQDNVRFGLTFRSQSRLDKRQVEQRVASAIEEVGLSHASTLFPDQISGGMAQRVALARCLAREPRVLLLDEPFGALDEITRHDMQQLLLKARDRHQMAVLLITHDIDEALLVSDRIALLAGTPATIQRSWMIEGTGRDLLSPPFVALRVTILKALREHMHSGHDSTIATTRVSPSEATTDRKPPSQPLGLSHRKPMETYAHVL